MKTEEYYATLDDMPCWTVSVVNGDLDKYCVAFLWCKEHLPEGSWWYSGAGTFEFDDEKNFMWFKLAVL